MIKKLRTLKSIEQTLETKSLDEHILGLKIMKLIKIGLFKDMKRAFTIKITFSKGPLGNLESLSGQKIPVYTMVSSLDQCLLNFHKLVKNLPHLKVISNNSQVTQYFRYISVNLNEKLA